MHSRTPAGRSGEPAKRAVLHAPNCLLVVLCLSAAPTMAQFAGGLSFERAQVLAVERAPMLTARQASVDAADQLRLSADQLPDPRLLAGINNLPVTGADRFTVASDPMTMRNIGLMQDVPNGAKRAARAQGAEARAERERALLDAELLSIRREVAQAWLMRYFAERQLALFQTLEDENRLLQSTVASRIAGGRSMPADATMARQEALALADRRDELARERAKASATLTRWLGDDAMQALAGGPPALTVEPAALQRGVAQQADLRVFEPMVRMTNAEMLELEAARRGDWNWEFMYSKRGSAYGDMVSFQFTFELPFWAEKRQDPQIAAKQKEAARIEAERDDLLRRRREDVDLQLAEFEELTRKLDRLGQAAVPLANERVGLAMAAYEAGRGDLAAVLVARRERAELGLRAIELEARQYALRARLNYLMAEQR
jgi:cobalt-zinc-cadmium efflux system outer membrane protein